MLDNKTKSEHVGILGVYELQPVQLSNQYNLPLQFEENNINEQFDYLNEAIEEYREEI
jgi:hypothetical protein